MSDEYKKARDEWVDACESATYKWGDPRNLRRSGADWAYSYARKELLESDEMKALIEAAGIAKAGCPTGAKGCTCVRDTAWIALSNFKAKFGDKV